MATKRKVGRPTLNPNRESDYLRLRVPPELRAALAAMATKRKTTLSVIVRELLEAGT